jgi:hypothetical protein
MIHLALRYREAGGCRAVENGRCLPEHLTHYPVYSFSSPFLSFPCLRGPPDVHYDDPAFMIVVVLISPGHKDLCPDHFSFERALENKRVNRAVAGDESTEVPPQVFHVRAWKKLAKKIPTYDRLFRIA